MKRAYSYLPQTFSDRIKKLTIKSLVGISFIGMCVSPYLALTKPILGTVGTVACVYSLAFGVFLAFKKKK